MSHSAPYSARAQRPKRKPKALPPPSMTPHDCIVLGVDPGARAGWAIWHRDTLVQWGELSGLDYPAVMHVVNAALQLAHLGQVPCVLVIEKPPTHHAKRSFASLLGSGETRAAWRMAWKQCGGKEKHIVRAEPNRWRGAVMPGWVGAGRAAIKAQEQRAAPALAQQHSKGGRIAPIGAESAPAILIGRWGTRAGEVARAIGRTA